MNKKSHLIEQEETRKRCDDTLRQKPNLNAFLQKGIALLYLSKTQEAFECFQQLNKVKESEYAFLYQGIARLDEKAVVDAEWCLGQALQRNQESLKNVKYFFEAMIAIKNNEYTKALESLDKGIALNDKNPLNYCGKAELYLEQQDDHEQVSKALTELKKAHDVRENCPLHGRYMFFSTLARIYAKIDASKIVAKSEKDLKLAVKLFQQAQTFHPYQDELCIYEGNTLTKLWKVEQHANDQFAYSPGGQKSLIGQALESYEKALKLDAMNISIALNNAGIAHQELGHFDEALKKFEAVIKLEPENPLFRFNRGKCYYRQAFHKKNLEHEAKAVEDFLEVARLADNVELLLKQQKFSDGNLGLIVPTLGLILKALGLAGKVRRASKSSGDNITELEEKRFVVVNQILNESSVSIQQNELNKDLMALIEELQANLKKVENKLDLKLDDYKKKFDQTLIALSLNSTEQKSLEDYRTSFAKTCSAALGSAEAINGGGISLDTANDFAGLLSFLAGCTPLFGELLSSAVEKISDIWMEGKIKARANLLTHAFPTRQELDQLVLETSCLIIQDEQKRKAIIRGSFSYQGPRSRLDQAIDFLSALKDKCQILAPEEHLTQQNKIGNEDAHILIEQLFLLHGNNKLKAQDCLKLLQQKVYQEENFCFCEYSNPVKKSGFLKKICTQCQTSVKEYYKCSGCPKGANIRVCNCCYSKYMEQQQQQPIQHQQ